MLAANSPAEQLDLYEELALMRDVAGRAVQTYAEAVELAASKPESTDAKELMMLAGCAMKEHLDDIVKTVESISRIENGAKDKVSIAQLHFFIDSILRCSHQVYADDEQKAMQFAELVRMQIKLPSLGVNGTMLTPDADVMAMDASVPPANNMAPIDVLSSPSTNGNGVMHDASSK